MGNYLSCTTLPKPPGGAAASSAAASSGAKCARVILPDGSVRQVPLPATAAELMMMDAPGHFLVDAAHHIRGGSSGLQGGLNQLGARLAALHADEELELGAVYATFPMKRLGTPLAAADLARLSAAAAAGTATTSSGGREARRASAKVANAVVVVAAAEAEVAEAAVEEEEEEEEASSSSRVMRLEEMVDDAAAAEIGVWRHRLSNARCRRPTLETIEEESYLPLVQIAR